MRSPRVGGEWHCLAGPPGAQSAYADPAERPIGPTPACCITGHPGTARRRPGSAVDPDLGLGHDALLHRGAGKTSAAFRVPGLVP